MARQYWVIRMTKPWGSLLKVSSHPDQHPHLYARALGIRFPRYSPFPVEPK